MDEGGKPDNNTFTLFWANSVITNRPDSIGSIQKIVRNRKFSFFE